QLTLPSRDRLVQVLADGVARLARVIGRAVVVAVDGHLLRQRAVYLRLGRCLGPLVAVAARRLHLIDVPQPVQCAAQRRRGRRELSGQVSRRLGWRRGAGAQSIGEPRQGTVPVHGDGREQRGGLGVPERFTDGLLHLGGRFGESSQYVLRGGRGLHSGRGARVIGPRRW